MCRGGIIDLDLDHGQQLCRTGGDDGAAGNKDLNYEKA